MASGRVSAYGEVAMWGRIIKCQRGYKAQHVRIQTPVVLDLKCYGSCDNQVQKVELPPLGSAYNAWCWTDHRPAASDAVTIGAGFWLSEAKRELEARYEGIEVLSWM